MNYKREDKLFILYEKAREAHISAEYEIAKHYYNLIIAYCGIWGVDPPILYIVKQSLEHLSIGVNYIR